MRKRAVKHFDVTPCSGRLPGMGRWQDLFDDLSAQLEAGQAAELAAEVADRTRREAGAVALDDRLAAAAGGLVQVRVPGHAAVRGRLVDTGPGWLLVALDARREALVPRPSVLALTGLTHRAQAPGTAAAVSRRLDLRWALRALTRERAGVGVLLADGSTLTGTLDRVGADHVDLAEHPAGELRRAAAVRAVWTIPLTALSAVVS